MVEWFLYNVLMSLFSLFCFFLLVVIWGGSFLFMCVVVLVFGVVFIVFGCVLLSSVGLFVLIGLMWVFLFFGGKFRVMLVLGVVNFGIFFLMFLLVVWVLFVGYSVIFNVMVFLMGVVIGVFGFCE